MTDPDSPSTPGGTEDGGAPTGAAETTTAADTDAAAETTAAEPQRRRTAWPILFVAVPIVSLIAAFVVVNALGGLPTVAPAPAATPPISAPPSSAEPSGTDTTGPETTGTPPTTDAGPSGPASTAPPPASPRTAPELPARIGEDTIVEGAGRGDAHSRVNYYAGPEQSTYMVLVTTGYTDPDQALASFGPEIADVAGVRCSDGSRPTCAAVHESSGAVVVVQSVAEGDAPTTAALLNRALEAMG